MKEIPAGSEVPQFNSS